MSKIKTKGTGQKNIISLPNKIINKNTINLPKISKLLSLSQNNMNAFKYVDTV